MSTHSSFTPEFKVQAVELAIEQGNVSKTARELGIGSSTLAKWVKLYKEQVAESGLTLTPVRVFRSAGNTNLLNWEHWSTPAGTRL